MNPLNAYLAQSIMDDRVAHAEAQRRAAGGRRREPAPRYDSVTIRRATPDDRASLERLAELDGRAAPDGVALLAEVDDHVLAAIWLEAHRTVADPLHPTAELVALLEARAKQLGHGSSIVTRPFRRAVALVRRTA
jgi:hypothetical protein